MGRYVLRHFHTMFISTSFSYIAWASLPCPSAVMCSSSTVLGSAMSDAARKQQANSSWWENLAKSNSTAYNLKQANKKAKYDQIGALSKDILSMIQYNQAKGFKNRILNMYNQALNTYQQDIIGGLPA